MSSQSLNATTYSGETLAPYYFPPRDASDVTRIKKERLIYRENKSGSTVPPGNPLPVWIKGGNQFRLSYLFGKVECGDCNTGNPWTKPVLGS